jgi:hypothetical protein
MSKQETSKYVLRESNFVTHELCLFCAECHANGRLETIIKRNLPMVFDVDTSDRDATQIINLSDYYDFKCITRHLYSIRF